MAGFLGRMLFAAICLYLGYAFGIHVANATYEELEQENYQGLSLTEHDNEDKEMSFTYCRPAEIKEAFKVSEGILPKWVLAPNIDVMISPEFKVVVHKENGYNVVATQNDYLIRDASGDYFACPIEMFETSYQKIET